MSFQVPEDHLRAISESFQKVLDAVRFSSNPEVTAYLRLLGDEIGYLKNSEMRKMFETFFMYSNLFTRILPAQVRTVSRHELHQKIAFKTKLNRDSDQFDLFTLCQFT